MLYIKSIIILMLLSTITLMGCLESAKQVYTFEVNDENKGKLTIDIYDIHSNVMDDSKDRNKTINDDFDSLIYGYHNGTIVEDNYPKANLVSKVFYAYENKLCAKYIFKFDKIEDVFLYQFEAEGPYLFYYSSLDNILLALGTKPDPSQTNGEVGSYKLPIVYWPKGTKTFTTTYITTSPTNSENINLLKMYNKWNK